jgi:hypothetical protein
VLSACYPKSSESPRGFVKVLPAPTPSTPRDCLDSSARDLRVLHDADDLLGSHAASGLVTLLTRTGVKNPESVDWTGLLWHVVLWDPWWLLGGILFCVAALDYHRRSPGSVQAAELSSRAHYAQ